MAGTKRLSSPGHSPWLGLCCRGPPAFAHVSKEGRKVPFLAAYWWWGSQLIPLVTVSDRLGRTNVVRGTQI